MAGTGRGWVVSLVCDDNVTMSGVRLEVGPPGRLLAGAAGRATRGARRRRGHGRQGRVAGRVAARGGVVGVPAVRGPARAVGACPNAQAARRGQPDTSTADAV